MAITILVTLVLFIAYSFYDLNKEKTFTKRQKVNWSFVLAILPVTGSIVYFICKTFIRNKHHNFESRKCNLLR